MANTNVNGSHSQQKKSLAVQLDRLDSIIDALDVALPEAVADAVRQAVSAAVQQTVEAVLREILSRPEVLHALAPQPAPVSPAPVAQVAPARGSSLLRRMWSWLSGKVVSAASRVCQKASQAGKSVCSLLSAFGAKLKPILAVVLLVTFGLAGWVRRNPLPLGVAAVVGLGIGVGGYLAGPVVSSAALGVTGSLISLAGSTLASLLRLPRSLQTPEAQL